MEEKYKGIFYVTGAGFFATQIIVAKDVAWENHIWLKSLADGLDEQRVRELIGTVGKLPGREEKEYAAAVMQIAAKSNRGIFAKIKEEDTAMYNALVELMKPEIDKAWDEAWDEATAQKTVQAIENAMKKLNMSEKEACNLMDTTIKDYRAYKERIQKSTVRMEKR